MAKARAAYKQELERHAKALDRIRTDPKYDLVLSSQKIPSFFRESEKEAYLRFASNYMGGKFNRNIPMCVAEAWDYVNGGGAGSRPQTSPSWSADTQRTTRNFPPGMDQNMRDFVRGGMEGYYNRLAMRRYMPYGESPSANDIMYQGWLDALQASTLPTEELQRLIDGR